MEYQIKVIGKIDPSWSDWLGSTHMEFGFDEYGSTTTNFIIEVSDQPALFGILDRIRNMNLIPISVERIYRDK